MKTFRAVWPLFALVTLGVALLAALGFAPARPRDVQLAAYATPLEGRTRNQKRNARLAAACLDGKTVRPGEVFSFNHAVQSWTQDAGFVKAPVSFDGELVRAYGGGVCQTSTTLYNAALLAGLPVLERHPHNFRPRYAVPGRDAAVAFPGIDLRFRNPYPWPLHLKAEASGGLLRISLWGREKLGRNPRIETVILDTMQPQRLTRMARTVRDEAGRPQSGGRAFGRSAGTVGYRTATYRLTPTAKGWKREKLSADTYPAMNRVVALTEDEVIEQP